MATIKAKGHENMTYFEMYLNESMLTRIDKTWDNFELEEGISGGFEIEVPLEIGENKFQIKAYDDAGNEAIEEVVINRKDPNAVDPVDTKDLLDNILKAKSIVEVPEKYVVTDEQIAELNKLIEEAKTVINEQQPQEKVDEINNKLTEALANIKEKEIEKANKAQLIGQKEDAEELLKKKDKYVLDEQQEKALQDLIKKAEDLVKKEDATQEEVDKLAKEIKDALANIKEKEVEKADTKELQNQKEDAKELLNKKDEYKLNEQQEKALQDLIKKAEELAKKEDATQEEVDKLAKEIKDEIAKIKENTTTPDEKEIKTERVAGRSRIETAVEVSKKYYESADTVIVANYANRYETSAKIAQEIIKLTGTKKAVVASGENFADALTVAPLANKNNMPILLVQKNKIPEEVKEVLKQMEEVLVVGGELTITKEVESQLPNPTRIAGANRYDTAKKIYEYGFKDRKEVNIANGTTAADSLVIGSIDCPILLAEANEIPEATKQAFEEAKFEKVNVFGGENSISESVVKELIK